MPIEGVPLWAVILEAAGGDPLRAQEIEAGLNETWWQYYQVYAREKGRADREEADRLKELYGR